MRWFEHHEKGSCPIELLLDCVFVLTPEGRILHYHIEEISIHQKDGDEIYLLNGCSPQKGRDRCQIIPPLVNTFSMESR